MKWCDLFDRVLNRLNAYINLTEPLVSVDISINFDEMFERFPHNLDLWGKLVLTMGTLYK